MLSRRHRKGGRADGDFLELVRRNFSRPVGEDDLHVRCACARALRRRREAVLREDMAQVSAGDDLLVLLHELLVDARPQLVAHDDVDDRRCDRNSDRHGECRGEREPQAEGHGSVPRTVWIRRGSSSASVFRRR